MENFSCWWSLCKQSIFQCSLWGFGPALHCYTIVLYMLAWDGALLLRMEGKPCIERETSFYRFFFFSVFFEQCLKWKGRPCAGKHKNKSSQGWLFFKWALSPKCTVHSSEGRSTKDLGIDICRVVGLNLCVVNQEFSSGLLLLLSKTKTVKKCH